MKRCSVCKEVKPLVKFFKDRSHTDGLSSRCKTCKNIQDKEAYKKASPERLKKIAFWRWKNQLKRLYGLTPEDYHKMLEWCKGGCAICGKEFGARDRRLHIDHDHITGKVRGLLCSSCNHGLGNFHDNPKLLRIAIAYLAYFNVREEGT